jgi:hypothetical protein
VIHNEQCIEYTGRTLKEITVSGRKGKVKFKRSFIGVNAEIEAKKLEKRMTKAGFTVKTTTQEGGPQNA